MAALQRRFRSRAAADLNRIEWLRVTEQTSTDLQRLVHDLAGAACMFGYPALGEAALAIDDCYARGEAPESGLFDRLTPLLREAAAN